MQLIKEEVNNKKDVKGMLVLSLLTNSMFYLYLIGISSSAIAGIKLAAVAQADLIFF